MTTLTEFLTARLDEDEAAARAAYDRPSGYRILGTPETEDHFARWKPLRVLAEVDAKRRIAALHEPQWNDSPHIDNDWYGCLTCSEDEPCATLRLLALPYAEHEDYDEEWRP